MPSRSTPPELATLVVSNVDEDASQLDLFGFEAALNDTSYQVVSAPLQELGERGIPKLLRKANVAVHVYPTKGKYSLVMRRLFNALLALSHSKLKTMAPELIRQIVADQKVVQFEASGADIKRLIGQDNVGDYQGLYEMLDGLVGLRVVWDALAPDGERWTYTAGLLSQWGRSQESGKICWAWMPDVFWMMFNPENPYTPIDLELTRKFHSKYTLALYENCFRYRKIGHTPWRDTRDWVLLVAGPDRYKDYREFKRSVLKKAKEEMLQTVGCSIVVEEEEDKGQFNRIKRIRFLIKDKEQEPLGFDTPVTWHQGLHTRLRKLGLADATVRKLLLEYDSAYLQSQLELTQREVAKGTVRSPAAWFMAAVESRYADQLAEQEKMTQRVLDDRKQQEQDSVTSAEFSKFRTAEALRWFDALGEALKEEKLTQFLASYPQSVRDRYEKDGLRGKMVESLFMLWACSQPGLVERPELQSIEAYLGLANKAPLK